MNNPLEKIAELRGRLKDVDFGFDCTDTSNTNKSFFLQGQIVAEATMLAFEAQAHQADSLARIADHMEVIAFWCKNVRA